MFKAVSFLSLSLSASASASLPVGQQEEVVAQALDEVLLQGIEDSTYPAVVAMVGNQDQILYSSSLGHLTYSPDDPLTSLHTPFDIASLTKVFSTTSAVALLYQRGLLPLQEKVANVLGQRFAAGGKEEVTVENCLLHNAGFSPDPDPCYWYPEFQCPNTDDEYPAEDFSCMDQVYDSLMKESLNTPPGAAEVYSDLSFITLQMVVGTLALKNDLVTSDSFLPQCQEAMKKKHRHNDEGEVDPIAVVCAFESFVRQEVFQRDHGNDGPWLNSTSYLPSEAVYPDCAPTMNDTGEGSYTHRRLQGQVADGNCYAMGGIAGHAGVFTTAPDIARFLQYMIATRGGYAPAASNFLNATTIQLFTTIKNVTQSSRAYGWTTNSFRDSENADNGYDHSCGLMSGETFMHIGYTGTCMCADPQSSLWSVILTNRAYNCQGQKCPTELSTAVKSVYRKFNTIVAKSFGQMS